MIDFHINIGKSLSISQAMLYAKSAGLKAFALICPLAELPHFFINPHYLMDLAENSHIDFTKECVALEEIARVKEARLSFQKKHFNFNDPLFLSIIEMQKQIHELSIYYDVQAYFGVNIMYIPPLLLESTIMQYRLAGVSLVGVHGESISDIVEEGTNFSAVNARADILYNAGLIDDNVTKLAAENGVYVEISTHPNHAYCNAHIAKKAREHNVKMILGSNAGTLAEIHTPEMQKRICHGANITFEELYNTELLKDLQTYR